MSSIAEQLTVMAGAADVPEAAADLMRTAAAELGLLLQAVAGNARRPPRAPIMGATVAGLWEFTDHACKYCAGRVMSRADGNYANSFYRCACCGAEAAHRIEDVCMCGAADGADYHRCVPVAVPGPLGVPEIGIVRIRGDDLSNVLRRQNTLPLKRKSP